MRLFRLERDGGFEQVQDVNEGRDDVDTYPSLDDRKHHAS